MFWHVLARDVTHTSKARTKRIIGRSEYVDWSAFYEIVDEENKKAIEKANRNR